MTVKENPDLLRQIVEQPNDLTTRQVYADWLEEHDQTDRARLIRIQLELRTTTCANKIKAYDPDPSNPGWFTRCSSECTYCDLAEEAINILSATPTGVANGRLWAGSIGFLTTGSFRWELGFVSHVGGDWKMWLDHGPTLVQEQPILEFFPRNCRPANVQRTDTGARLRGWYPRRPDAAPTMASIPQPIYDALPVKQHTSEYLLLRSASEGALRWARRQALLPELLGGVSPRAKQCYYQESPA